MSGILMIFFLQHQTMVSWLEKQGKSRATYFTFLLLDPSQFWNLNATRNLANKETLELLTDSDEKRINISNFKFNEDGFIANQTNFVLEATYADKVIVNKKDPNNPRQLWKKGCPNFEGFFMIEHSESQMLLSVTTDAVGTDYSIVLIGLFENTLYTVKSRVLTRVTN